MSAQPETLRELAREIPSDRLFVELNPDLTEKIASELADELRLERVATGAVYFQNPSDHKSHRILRSIFHNTTLSRLMPGHFADQRHFFCDEKEIQRRYPNSESAITNSHYLAKRCKSDWAFINTIFPEISLKEVHQANQKLTDLVHEGAALRFEKLTPIHKKRIKMELDLIHRKGFSPYFLIVQDIVKQTRATIGRGSGAGSIVSYCLFITQVDPVKHHLSFERFIHEDRLDMPDLDIDFCWDERDSILDYVFKKYGTERTAMVSSQVFLQPRSAVRETGKVYGLSEEEIKKLTSRISRSFGDHIQQSLNDLGSLKMIEKDPLFIEVVQEAEKIVGAFHVSSVHPGGVIIVPDEIRKYVPILIASKGVPIVEWDKDQVEDAGLLKIDLLGNRSLSVVRDTLKQIPESEAVKVDYHKLNPVDDPATRALLSEGNSLGVFYIESPATRQLLKRAGRVDFEHVVIYSSIIRPAANHFINLLLERIHGAPWELLHKDLEFLRETYGLLVYEDQVGYVARQIGGFGFGMADALRKTMGRESKHHLIPQWREKFLSGALKRGYTKELVDSLWEMIESFLGYSFCKSHSASYAMLSFTCAYLKANFPAEFLASVVANGGGFYSPYAYLSEARKMGIRILPPEINSSQNSTTGSKNSIRVGFSHILKLSQKAIEQFLQVRHTGPFVNLSDFLIRCPIGLAETMRLVQAGAFLELEPDSDFRKQAVQVLCHYLPDQPKGLLNFELTPLILTPFQKHLLEMEILGIPISYHPLSFYRPFIHFSTLKASDLPQFVGSQIRLVGVHITHKVVGTKTGKRMAFLTLEDETGLCECTLFSKAFEQARDLLRWEQLFIVEGKVDEHFGFFTLEVEKITSLTRYLRRKTQTLKKSASRGEIPWLEEEVSEITQENHLKISTDYGGYF